MKEKEKIIIESAMRLFATKGFDSTSIQEIANDAGISKGAFYLYFKSKEALLFKIFTYNYDKIKAKMNEIKKRNLTPRDLFVEYIVCQYEAILQQREFIIMQTREHAIPFNESIADFIKKMKTDVIENIKTSLSTIYPNLEDYYWDLTVLVKGIISSYVEMIIFDKVDLNLHELARYILRRTDNLAEGFLKSNEQPFLKIESLQNMMNCSFSKSKIEKEDLLKAIRSAKEEFENYEDIIVSLDVIEAEINFDLPRSAVIKGMLGNLNKENELKPLKRKIMAYFGL